MFFLALLLPPVLLIAKRVASAKAVLVTVLVTWAVSTAASYIFLSRDFDNPVFIIWFFVIVLPAATITPAGLVAAGIAQPRGQKIPSLGVAALGFLVGCALLLLVASIEMKREPHPVFQMAILVALPAIYAACGAVYGTSIANRRIN